MTASTFASEGGGGGEGEGGVRVLSYNVWGIFAANHLRQRMPKIAQRLREYDIVCLQEQFDAKHAPILFEGSVFPYVHRFVSARVGSGLCIASRYPILSNTFIPFRCGGRIERMWEGDGIANKGFGVSRVLIPNSVLHGGGSSSSHTAATGAEAAKHSTEVLVINTHPIAQYQKYSKIGGYRKERNAGYRLCQLHQLAQLLVAMVVPGVTPFILCGDFNAGAHSPEVAMLKAYLRLYGIRLAAAVHDEPTYSLDNMYCKPGSGTFLDALSMSEDLPVQLDHVFFHENVVDLVPDTGRVVMTEQYDWRDPSAKPGAPSIPFMLSDHFGVTGTFSLSAAATIGAALVPRPARQPNPAELTDEDRKALAFAVVELRHRVQEKRDSITWLTRMAAALAVVALSALVGAHDWVFSPRVSALLCFLVGGITFLALSLGQIARLSLMIMMDVAADDMDKLLTSGSPCSGWK